MNSTLLRTVVAGTWLGNGLWAKVLGRHPRHGWIGTPRDPSEAAAAGEDRTHLWGRLLAGPPDVLEAW